MSEEFVEDAAASEGAAEGEGVAVEAACGQDAVEETAAQGIVEDTDDDATKLDESVDIPQTVEPVRQWVSLSRGSCVCWVGHGALDKLGQATRGNATNFRACALLVQEGCPEEVAELVRRQLTDAQFEVSRIELPAEDGCHSLEAAAALDAQLAEAKITADDMVCAVGGLAGLSLAAYVCKSWCGGIDLACVPLDLAAAVIAPITPRGLDVNGQREVVGTIGHAKYFIIDLALIDLDPNAEPVRLARAMMAQTALVDAEKSFSDLWDRAGGIAEGGVFSLAEQIVATIKSRGRVASSTSVAVRQGIGCGETFVRTLQRLAPELPESALVGEALRFASRLAAGRGDLPVDDVLAIDELLDRLQIAPVSCTVDPEALFVELKAERFLRSRRFLLALPRKLGQVRMAVVEDELLREHTAAWCAVHAA